MSVCLLGPTYLRYGTGRNKCSRNTTRQTIPSSSERQARRDSAGQHCGYGAGGNLFVIPIGRGAGLSALHQVFRHREVAPSWLLTRPDNPIRVRSMWGCRGGLTAIAMSLRLAAGIYLGGLSRSDAKESSDGRTSKGCAALSTTVMCHWASTPVRFCAHVFDWSHMVVLRGTSRQRKRCLQARWSA
jgi:hypothetical protein